MRNKDVLRIVLSAMFIAIVFVATFINVPFPGAVGGLVHLGTVVMLIIAMRFGPYYGAMAGGFGMGLFDVMGGWMAWAPGTFVVRFVMGLVVGLVAHHPMKGQGKDLLFNVFAWAIGLVIMVVGYYFYEAIFLTTFEASLASIPGNLIQFAIGALAPFITLSMSRVPAIDDLLGHE
jgi:uncharacterized membrane protein